MAACEHAYAVLLPKRSFCGRTEPPACCQHVSASMLVRDHGPPLYMPESCIMAGSKATVLVTCASVMLPCSIATCRD